MKPESIVLAVFDRRVGDRALADLEVGGISLLLRALRSASRAGPDEVVVYAADPEAVQRVVDGDAGWSTTAKPRGQLRCAFEVRPLPEGVDEIGTLLDREYARLPAHCLVSELDGLTSPGVFVDLPLAEGVAAIGDSDGRFLGVWCVRSRPSAGFVDALARATVAPERVVAKPTYHAISAMQDLEPAFATLRRSLRKPLARSADGLTAYYINRPISLMFSRRLVATSVTPNQVTAAALLMGLAAAWCASRGTWGQLVLGGLLLQASSIFDGVDGELARMRLTMSKSGEWFDTVCDDVINLSFLLGLGFACQARTGDSMYGTLGIVGAAVGAVLALSMYRDEIRAGVASHNHFEWNVNAGPLQPVVEGFGYLAKRDTYTLLLVGLLALDWPGVAFWVMFVGTIIIAIAALAQKLFAAAKR